MKTKKLTKEQLDTMSYSDVAYLVLTEAKSKMKIQDLFKKVITLMELPDSYFENKIGDFFGLLSTDKRFAMVEKGYWDLKINHSAKITDDEEEDEEELETEEGEEVTSEEETDDSEINYDDESIDDDEEEDDLKDLVIMDDSDESEM